MAKHLETGKLGEEKAVEFLLQKGYFILETNWRFSRAEIDIIAKEGETLVFVEVKTRSYDYYGKPEAFVNEHKKKLLSDAAAMYMEEIDHEWECRFDIIAILMRNEADFTIEHFEDAFFPGLEEG